MNNENIEIKSIEIKENNNNAISVEITDNTEYLIAAHNASNEAHNSIVQELEGKINALNGTINELEDTMVSTSNLPQKLSDLTNDTNFVSESTLIQALETRGLINNTTLDEKETTINNLITEKSNTLNTKIENLDQRVANLTDPEAITTMCMPSQSSILFVSSFMTGKFYFTMPANGVLGVGGHANVNGAALVVTRVDAVTEQIAAVDTKDNIASIELLVNKGEVVMVHAETFTLSHVKFSYLNGVVPEDDEEEEGEEE